MTSTKNIWAAIVAVAIIGLIGWILPKVDFSPFGGTTNYDALDVTDGYYVDGTAVIDGDGNWDGAVTGTTGTYSGILNAEGGFVEGGILTISTTSSSYTLTAAELDNVKVISIADMGAGQAALALTLPATSTMTALLPTSGDAQEWIIDSLAASAATTTTITAGTGIDIDGTTANDDVINGGVSGKLICWRLASTDVRCIVEEMVDAG